MSADKYLLMFHTEYDSDGDVDVPIFEALGPFAQTFNVVEWGENLAACSAYRRPIAWVTGEGNLLTAIDDDHIMSFEAFKTRLLERAEGLVETAESRLAAARDMPYLYNDAGLARWESSLEDAKKTLAATERLELPGSLTAGAAPAQS